MLPAIASRARGTHADHTALTAAELDALAAGLGIDPTITVDGPMYVEQRQLVAYQDLGAFGFDIVDGYKMTVRTSYRLCSRPSNLAVRAEPRHEVSGMQKQQAWCRRTTRV